MDQLEALIADTPYCRYLGLRVNDGGDLVLPGDAHHGADESRLHGGILAAAVEAAALLHLRATRSTMVRTVELTVDLVRAGHFSDTTISVRPLHIGRRLARVHVVATQQHGTRLVASATGTWLLA
ncbi:MAG TPA: hotdog domain-containing protein [Ilumatobacteraceae bacterium]|nr:hotdog domain-containing protein [Ilumatobacteraceae bacterium]